LLTNEIRAALKKYASKYGKATKVLVRGYTSGPKVLDVDYKLSLERAKNASRFLRSLNTKLVSTGIKSYQDLTVNGPSARKVKITLYW
jgi:outer membrane protein OmpA-like peptidoglycan-associated protein